MDERERERESRYVSASDREDSPAGWSQPFSIQNDT